MADKNLMRNRTRAKLRELTKEEKAKASESIARHLLESHLWKNSPVIMFYASLPDEPSTDSLLQAAWEQDKTVCMPRIGQARYHMELFKLPSTNHLRMGRFNILEPDPDKCEPFPLDQCNLMLVPGVAFDLHGNRLGRGGAFYDNMLASPSNKSTAAGMFFSCQAVPQVPTHEHDRAVHWLVNENGLVEAQHVT